LGLLFGSAAVFESVIDVAVFKEIFPGVLVLSLQRGDHNLLLVGEAEKLVLACVEEDATQRSQLLKTVVVDDLATVFGDDCYVGRVHKDDVEHRDSEARRHLVFGRGHTALFHQVFDLLQLGTFVRAAVIAVMLVILGTWVSHDELVACVDLIDIKLSVEEKGVAHPAKASDLVATPILLLLIDQLQAGLLDGVSEHSTSARVWALLMLGLFVELAPWDSDAVRVAQILVVLVLVKDEAQAIVATHKLIELGRAGSDDRHKLVDFDDFDIFNGLLVLDLDHAVEFLNRAAIALLRLGHVAGVEDVTLTRASHDLEKGFLDDFDVDRLERHLGDRAALAVIEVVLRKDVDPENVPMVVEELCVAQQDAVHARIVHVHLFYTRALEEDLVVQNLLRVTQGHVALAQLFLGEEFILCCEDPELIVLKGDLLVHGLRRRVAEGDILHSERAIQTSGL